MTKVAAPPPTVTGLRVLRYATTASLKFSGRSYLFVDGEEVGRVPRLIIGEEMYLDSEVALLFCDRYWNAIGIAAGYRSIREAEARADRMYAGIGSRWVNPRVTKRQARAHEELIWKRERCSFCKRLPPQFNRWFPRNGASICDDCVRKFFAKLTG